MRSTGATGPGRLEGPAGQRERQLRAIQEISARILAKTNIQEIFHDSCQAAYELFDVDHSGLVLFEMAGTHTRGRVVAEHPHLGLEGLEIPVEGVEAEQHLLDFKQPLAIADVEKELALGPVREILRQWHIDSILIVPVISQGAVIGSFSLDAIGRTRQFTSEEAELCQIFAVHVALAIANAELIAQNEKQLQELTVAHERLRASFEASNMLLSLDAPHLVLQRIVEQARVAAGAAWASIILIDEMGHPQNLVNTDYQIDTQYNIRHIIRPDGISTRVMRSNRPARIEDTQQARDRVNPFVFQERIRAALCLPFSVAGRPRGVMWLHYLRPQPFPEHDVEALQLYVNQAAIAYDNARRLDELQEIRQAAEALAGAAGLPEVLDEIVRSARRVFRASATALWSYDAQRDRFILDDSVAVGIPADQWRAFRQEEPRDGQTAFTVMERGWAGVSDIHDEARFPYLGKATRELLGRNGVRSFQGIALHVGEEKLGVLYINYNHPRSFTVEEQANARTFATHAALALKKARLMKQVHKVHNTARIVAKVTTLANLSETMEAVVAGTLDALDCDAVTLYAYDPDRQTFHYPPTMIGVRFPTEALKLPVLPPNSIVYEVLRREEIMLVDRVNEHLLLRDRGFARREGIASCAAIPLVTGEQKVGVMFVNYHDEHRFTGDEPETMALFANQAAVAIRHAQLYEQVQRHADTMETLYEASREINSSLDLERILAEATRQVWHLANRSIRNAPAQYTSLALVDGNHLHLVAAYPPQFLADFQKIIGVRHLGRRGALGITGRAVRERKVQNVSDVRGNLDYLTYDPRVRSELAIPLIFEGQVIGVLNVEHYQLNAFDDGTVKALSAFAAQAVVAIQNARAYDNAKRLQEVSAALAGTLDLEKGLNLVMKAAMSLTGTDSGSVLFWDEGTQRFAPAYTTNAGGELQFYETTARKDGTAWQILHSGQPTIVNDADTNPELSVVARQKQRRAFIGVPLVGEARALGVLYINSREPRQFNAHQTALLQTLASYAAVAIEKIRQYEELKETRGLVDARTAVAWMGMASSAWRHDIENYTLTILNELNLLRAKLPAGALPSSQTHLDRIERLARQVLNKPITAPLSDSEGAESIRIHDLLRERLNRLCREERYRELARSFQLRLHEEATVQANPVWLSQIIDILVDNAWRAMQTSAHRHLTISTQRFNQGVSITFSDTGGGIPTNERPLLFRQPVPSTRGLGMGLIIAQTIAQAYGGRIWVDKSDPSGTAVVIWFPLEGGV